MTKFLTVLCILTSLLALSNSATSHADPPMLVPSSAPSSDCGSIIYDMVDCMPFLVNEESKPDDSCCSGFESVSTINVDCICEILKGSDNLGFPLDITRAMMLPTLCGVTSPFGECHISITPAPSPDNAPGPYGPRSPVLSPEPAVTGSPVPGPSDESPAPSPVPSPVPGPSDESPAPSPVPSPVPGPSDESPAPSPVPSPTGPSDESPAPSPVPSPTGPSENPAPRVPSPSPAVTPSPIPSPASAARPISISVVVLITSMLVVYLY